MASSRPSFESCVVLDGDKTVDVGAALAGGFESCVVLDGDKTIHASGTHSPKFESCVVLDGDKTLVRVTAVRLGLRVVLF